MGRRRWPWAAAGATGTAALLGWAGAGWHYAGRLTAPPARSTVPPAARDRVEVVTCGDGEVVLAGPDAARAGVWGLAGEHGYGQVGPPRGRTGDAVRRPYIPVEGRLSAGAPARLDGYAYPPRPTVLGLPVNEVTYRSPVGDCPAWWFPNRRDTWAVFVHGRAAPRHEAFRMLPSVHAEGLPALVISYRNDADAPPSPDGRSHLGATEWEDVEAAVRFALEHGARHVLPIGFSMGGACVLNFARGSPLAGRICGMVLEAPVLDWAPVIRAAAIERGLPAALLPVLLPATMRLAGARAGLDWARMRHEPASARHPKLLIHGEADATVPVALVDALAQARPDVVTYLRVAGAGHVRAWNADPDGYARAVRSFLRRVVPGLTAESPRR